MEPGVFLRDLLTTDILCLALPHRMFWSKDNAYEITLEMVKCCSSKVFRQQRFIGGTITLL